MPIYDYRCDHCGHVFSAVQSFSDARLEKCPNCGKTPRRLLSTPALLFKGSGWYKTDSRGADKSETKPESKTATKAETPSDTKKGESRSETKTDSKVDKPAPKSEAAS